MFYIYFILAVCLLFHSLSGHAGMTELLYFYAVEVEKEDRSLSILPPFLHVQYMCAHVTGEAGFPTSICFSGGTSAGFGCSVRRSFHLKVKRSNRKKSIIALDELYMYVL